jgi:hypothetical protein
LTDKIVEQEIDNTIDYLVQRGQAIVDESSHNEITKNLEKYTPGNWVTKLENIARHSMTYKVGDWGKYPTTTLAYKSSLVSLEFRTLRQFLSGESEFLVITNYPEENPLNIPNNFMARDLEAAKEGEGVEYQEDANIWIGPTKVSLAALIKNSFSTFALPEKHSAAFSFAVKRITYREGTLNIYFYDNDIRNNIYSFFPASFNLSNPVSDDFLVEIGHYINPAKASVDSVMANLINASTSEWNKGILGTASKMTNKLLDVAYETASDVQFYCCILFELLKKVGLGDDVEAQRDPEKVRADLERIQEDTQKLKNILEAVIGILEIQQGSVGGSPMILNVMDILTNTVYNILMTMMEGAREEMMRDTMDRIKEEANKAEDSSGLVQRCLPWEKILVIIVNAIFGRDGLFKAAQSFVQRMKNRMLLRAKAVGAIEEPENFETEVKSKMLPVLIGAVQVCEWILDLSIEGILICDFLTEDSQIPTDSSGQPSTTGDTQETDNDSNESSASGITAGNAALTGTTIISDDGIEGGSNVILPDGSISSRYLPNLPSGYKIDITNNNIDPIGFLLYKKESEIQKFITQRFGISAEEASETVLNARRGECQKTMSSEDLAELQSILDEAGTKV